MNDNLIAFLRQKLDLFPFERDLDLERFLIENLDEPSMLPIPAKLFLVDEVRPEGYGFPVAKSISFEELEAKLDKWLEQEIAARIGAKARDAEALDAYRAKVVKLAQNALHSSILADYHAVFWLVHSSQVARLFTALPRRIMAATPQLSRDQADTMKYLIHAKWASAIREAIPEIQNQGAAIAPGLDDRKLRFLRFVVDNPLIATEDFISSDLRELRSYFTGSVRKDLTPFRRHFDEMRDLLRTLIESDRLFRRSVALLGYPEGKLSPLMILDQRMQRLLAEHPSSRVAPDPLLFELTSRRLVEYFVVHALRRGIVRMTTTKEGDNVVEEHGKSVNYSRAIRPMDFGRRGVVEPIIFRYGLVYDITSFTQTLGEIARGGKQDEQISYRQMLEFQRELAEITGRHTLQFEKFLGDGAFYTSRRATRSINAAIEIQQFYSAMRAQGFAFNKGMRIALNYGYYRLLPMQISTDGAEIKEFYGPGIVELSRLTTGKATKELEDIQHLLLTHGYDQMDVYRFFAPLSRDVDTTEEALQKREFYAYINANGHLINEGIVCSIPFLRQLSEEASADEQKFYRLRTPWANYIGFPSASDTSAYIGIRVLGSVSLKGIGSVEVGEVVRLTPPEADISVIEDKRPLLQLLQQERNRSTASKVEHDDIEISTGDLVVCESHVRDDAPAVILVGEWDPVADEVRRPIQLASDDAERYGLSVPLTVEAVEMQCVAYHKLYRTLSRLETLPNFPVQAIRENTNFNGYIIGNTVERL